MVLLAVCAYKEQFCIAAESSMVHKVMILQHITNNVTTTADMVAELVL